MRVSRGVWLAALAALALPAAAQESGKDQGAEEPKASKRLLIGPQLGVYLPTSSVARQRFGSSWINIGFGLGPIIAPSDQGEMSLALTFISSRTRIQGSNNNVFQQNILMVPIGYQYRRGFGPSEGKGTQGYAGGSVGGLLTNMESQFDSVRAGWRTGAAASAFVGVVLNKKAYAEARYFQATKIKGFDLSGLNLSVGIRF